MSSIHAKQFEWLRVTSEIQAAELELKEAATSPETEWERRAAAALGRLATLRKRASKLLRDIDQLRSAPGKESPRSS